MGSNTDAQQNARRGYNENRTASPSGRHSWWYAECPKHGASVHMSILDGQCADCVKKREREGE